LTVPERTGRFEAATLPHLDAAYNLARWLLRDDQSAQDAVQEAYLRGLRYFESFRGGDARPWLLGIVRNCCYTWLRERGEGVAQVEFDEARDGGPDSPIPSTTGQNPEQLLMREQDRERIDKAIEGLPLVFREVIVLRELEELSYEQIVEAVAIPLGTVMSRLARARALLRAMFSRDE
jgi:RNA polymerase sigma factor (sigma-70 family)